MLTKGGESPAITVMNTSLVAVDPLLSVTVSRNVLVPGVVIPFTTVIAEEGDTILADPVPICDHAYVVILPSGSFPLPLNVTEEVGNVIL